MSVLPPKADIGQLRCAAGKSILSLDLKRRMTRCNGSRRSRRHVVSGQPTIGRGPARGGCADQAIAACGGDAREAVKALIVANQFLETDLEKLKASVSMGYARGKLFETAKALPRDRKDWYD